MTNQNGETVTNESLKGSVYVANFFFTICPGICPKMTSNLELVYNAYKGDRNVKFLSHSVMPWVDSVKVLKHYADLRGLNTGQWHFVTGDKEQIYDLARQAYFAEKEIGLDKETDEFLHTENFILVDDRGRIRGVYNGTIPLEMNRLKEDIATLKELG
ncbi:MAG: SCO family protein [Cyclobacteriaceae bacterium]